MSDMKAGQELQVVGQANATSLLVAIQQAASNPAVDMDKMERLFKMHQTMVTQEAEAKFNGALARAQAKIHPIVTDRENEHTHSRYSTLKAINREIVPIYSAEGLSVSFNTETKNDVDPIPAGMLRTIAILSHDAGHSRQYHIDLPLDDVGSGGKVNKTKVQAAGSTNEYSRRYLVRMIFNLATGDDTDGNKEKETGLSQEVRADFESAIDALVDRQGSEVLWKQIAAACFAVKDKAANDALKDKLVSKVATFQKAAA